MAGFRGGYTGKFLRVNLTAGSASIEDTPDVRKWLGPRGWNAKIAWEEIRPGVGPFDSENRLIFSTGPLAGTHAPTSGRTTISTIGPRGYPQPCFTAGTMGGYFGAELKYAGYDGLVVEGRAERPVYILIADDKVSLEDAGELWGKGVYATQRALKEKHGRACQIAAIGPAGENRVRFAAIIHRLSNAAGNSGFGGVMGAKNLKAIAIRGTGGVRIADPEGFQAAVRYVWNLTKGGIGRIGTPEKGYPNIACTHACSVRCGTHISLPPKALQTSASPNMTTCVDGAWIGGSHPEYRGIFLGDKSLGQELFIPHPPGMGAPGYDLANLANDMGLTSWAYDTWYRYFAALREIGITEVAGERIEPESPAWWQDWILRVSHREGLGDGYAEGLARFYDRYEVGPRYLAEFIESRGSRGHGWHREGRAMEPHPSPFWIYGALLYAVSTRDVTPSTHDFFFLNGLYGYPPSPKAPAEIPEGLKRLAERIYGSAEAIYPGDGLIEQVAFRHQHRAIIKDSMPVCDWVFPVLRRNFANEEELARAEELYGDIGAEAALYRPCTGIDLSIEEMERPIAERIFNLERALDIRNHGRSRDDDEAVIPHFQWPEKTDGTHLSPGAGEFHALLDRYYALRGWEAKTGWPRREKLEGLGLGEVAEELERLGKLL